MSELPPIIPADGVSNAKSASCKLGSCGCNASKNVGMWVAIGAALYVTIFVPMIARRSRDAAAEATREVRERVENLAAVPGNLIGAGLEMLATSYAATLGGLNDGDSATRRQIVTGLSEPASVEQLRALRRDQAESIRPLVEALERAATDADPEAARMAAELLARTAPETTAASASSTASDAAE
ncbi:MAG TPA: hypothetical protein DCQ98_16040 [Planctomycetaceae bacterium]|nr:hypothetical protein [Planctomycetaceae bacterium]